MIGDWELVVHHRYAGDGLTDLSGHRNHGHGAGGAQRFDADGLSFDGVASRVTVLPSPVLQELGALRCRARLRLDELGDRRTIMEGYLSFAWTVEPDAAVTGGIYAHDHWYAVESEPGAVGLGRELDMTFTYDGFGSSVLTIDNAIVASRSLPIGRLGGVQWPYGLSIGAWPDQDLRVLKGAIAELWVSRRRPAT